MKYYALTIRKTRPVSTLKQARSTISSLRFVIDRTNQKYPNCHIDPYWEVTKAGEKYNIHVHALVKAPDHIKYLEVKTPKGYHTHIVVAYEPDSWLSYCQKDGMSPPQIIRAIQEDLSDPVLPKAFNTNPHVHVCDEVATHTALMARIKKFKLV